METRRKIQGLSFDWTAKVALISASLFAPRRITSCNESVVIKRKYLNKTCRELNDTHASIKQ